MRFTYTGLMVPSLSPISYWEGVTDAYRFGFRFSEQLYRAPISKRALWKLGWIYGRIRIRLIS